MIEHGDPENATAAPVKQGPTTASEQLDALFKLQELIMEQIKEVTGQLTGGKNGEVLAK